MKVIIAVLLLDGAVVVVWTNYKQIREVNIFALVLVVQSLPFLSAVAMAAIEGSRFNEFAYWRSVEAKVAETLPRPTAVAESEISNQKSAIGGQYSNQHLIPELLSTDACHPGIAVSTSFTQYDVPNGIASSLKS